MTNPQSGMVFTERIKASFGRIRQLTWSPDGINLAGLSQNHSVWIFPNASGRLALKVTDSIMGRGIAWSPNGLLIAAGNVLLDVSQEKPARRVTVDERVTDLFWAPGSEQIGYVIDGRYFGIYDLRTKTFEPVIDNWTCKSLAWSPDGRTVAVVAADQKVLMWDHVKSELISARVLPSVPNAVAWAPDGVTLAVGLSDSTVVLWNTATETTTYLEGHSGHVLSVAFSHDGSLLASASTDDTVRVWAVGRKECMGVLPSVVNLNYLWHDVKFSPRTSELAVIGGASSFIDLWDIDVSTLLTTVSVESAVTYTNAKVVLMGDRGAGKSGLGLVLSGEPFRATESTHGRKVKVLDSLHVTRDDGSTETREIILWDLAGQPGYRLVHQLHLEEVALALVVFDANDESDPFSGVEYWVRALRQAEKVQGYQDGHITRLLVAAKADRGSVGVPEGKLQGYAHDHGFESAIITSAKEGWNIKELLNLLLDRIPWDKLPRISSTELFSDIKSFLVMEMSSGNILSTSEQLFTAYVRARGLMATDDLKQQFLTCIGLVQSAGLVRRLSFGGLVLLRPEHLDTYASMLINAARNEPGGFGSISEEEAKQGDFEMPSAERVKDREIERLILIATIEDLIRHEIVMREYGAEGPVLVFPAQNTREWSEAPKPQGKSVVFSFEGPILSVYATLAVRLAHSGMFVRTEMWRNAAIYSSLPGGTCGIWLTYTGGGTGEITLFFGSDATEETRYQFEEFVRSHLERRAISASIVRRRHYECPECHMDINEQAITLRKQRGFDWIHCIVCDTKISLLDGKDRVTASVRAAVSKMHLTADTQRNEAAAAASLLGKKATGDFDVFLAHNSRDKELVTQISDRLRKRGLYPWLDSEQIPPGQPFQDHIQSALMKVKSAAIFIGKHGMGRWEVFETRALVSRLVETNIPVIPVLLPGVSSIPAELPFLRELNWVKFVDIDDTDSLDQLVWGITSKQLDDSLRAG